VKYPSTAGFRVGILHVASAYELFPGNVQHAGSYRSPVMYQLIKGVDAYAIMRGDDAAAPAIVEGARALQDAGVNIIVGACGSFANYQRVIVDALEVPVYMSILLEVPLLLRALPPGRQLGIIFARSAAFTERVRENCGIGSTDRIVTAELAGCEEFQPLMNQCGGIDHEALRRRVVQVARQTLQANPRIGAWLIQCSDLPPYSADVRAATGLPVHDMIGLIDRLQTACAPNRYSLE